MDNRMIDVAIGLALAFALTSLLVTALQEAWSQMRGNRGKVLQQALASFVGDDPSFARALMDHPLIVALSPQPQGQADQRKPSYIEADSIVATLVAHLVQTHAGGVRPESPVALIDMVQLMATGALGSNAAQAAAVPAAALAGAAPVRPNPLFARGLASLVIGVENDWPAFEKRLAAWYDAVNERATGWFKRGVQKSLFMIGFVTAVVININPIIIGGRLWEDEALRAAVVKAAEAAVDERASAKPGTADAGSAASAPAESAAQAPASASSAPAAAPATVTVTATAPLPAELETALEQMARQLLAEGGTPGALRPAADRLIALDKALRGPIASGGGARAAALARWGASADALLDGLPAAAETAPVRASADQLRAALALHVAALGSPPKATADVKKDSEATAQRPPTSPDAKARLERCQERFSEDAMVEVCRRAADLSVLQSAGLPIGWTEAAWPTYAKGKCAGKPFDAKGCSVLDRLGEAKELGNFAIAVVGWAITALACTLGAPFWFDLLGKLTKLRASGARPSTTKGLDSAGQPPGSQLTRSPTSAGGAPPGTAAAPTSTEAMSDAITDAERALNEGEVRRIQRAIGLSDPECVGWFDGRTRAQIKRWQSERGFASDGELSRAQVTELLALAEGGATDDYLG